MVRIFAPLALAFCAASGVLSTPDDNAEPVAKAMMPMTTVPPAASSSLSSYVAGLTRQTEFSSVVQALATAMPDSVRNSALSNPTNFVNQMAAGKITESWARSLPSNVQSYFRSVGSVESSIIRAAATPTGRARPSSTSNSAASGQLTPQLMGYTVVLMGLAMVFCI